MFFLCSILSLLMAASGPPRSFGPFVADVVRVIDGDTLETRVHIWPGLTFDVHVRLADIDTPETFRPRCEAERRLGHKAHAWVEDALAEEGRRVSLSEVRLGKFAGRVIGKVALSDGRDLGLSLAREGLARKSGEDGARGTWCPPVS